MNRAGRGGQKPFAIPNVVPISEGNGGYMRPLFPALFLVLGLSAAGWAQDTTGDTVAMAGTASEAAEPTPVDPMEPRDAGTLTLQDFQWVARPIIVFADTPADPRFIEQLELLAERPEPLLERDVVIIVDSDPSARSAIRTELRPRGFALVIMQKDGSVGIRRPSPRDVREIMRAIDNFSLRQEELRRGG